MTFSPSEAGLSLADARTLLQCDPCEAEACARETLDNVPDCAPARLVLAAALRRQNRTQDARAILDSLVKILPHSADVQIELGLVLGDLGQHDLAVRVLRQALGLDRGMARAWRALSEQLFALGDNTAWEEASTQAAIAAITDPNFRSALARFQGGQIGEIEDMVLVFLEDSPDDAEAINLLAEISLSNQRAPDAVALLERCLEIAPAQSHARYNYAFALFRCGQTGGAIAELERLTALEPRNPVYRKLMGEALLADGRYEESLRCHEEMVRDFPGQPLAHMGRSLSLQASGKPEQCVEGYRETIRRFPSFAAAYWGLASLRTARFTTDEIAEMQSQLKRSDLSEEDRVFLHFAEGRALEQQERYRESFESYATANAIKRSTLTYNPEILTQHVARSKALLTREFFDERAGVGSTSDAPIFIVGLPRSGSSLVEQILSRHSDVEALGELPGILTLVRSLRFDRPNSNYPEVLGSLNSDELKALGEQYLSQARSKLRRLHVTDKAPRNFYDIGMIHLILPRAKILDVRRHPIGCCFSNFTQLYAQGQAFTYSQTDLGRYYRDYVELMEHYDEVLQGKVHRLQYEDLIENFEPEVRRLLDYLELPFEEDCLRFHDSKRHIRTPSADQVRSPIYANAMEHWRSFEPWLDPLKEALGPASSAYRSGRS